MHTYDCVPHIGISKLCALHKLTSLIEIHGKLYSPLKVICKIMPPSHVFYHVSPCSSLTATSFFLKFLL